MGILFLILLPAVILLVVIGGVSGRRKALALCMSEIQRQGRSLKIRRKQLTSVDHYGTLNQSAWEREKVYFCESRLLPMLQRRNLAVRWRSIARSVAEEMDRQSIGEIPKAAYLPDAITYSAAMSPLEYERYCAAELTAVGWKTRLTVATGDQGADVIAIRDGKTLVLQCKLYSNPVGNKAVQEVHAARTYQRADIAAVVTNASYTPSARQLAHSSSVLLLHHDELHTIET